MPIHLEIHPVHPMTTPFWGGRIILAILRNTLNIALMRIDAYFSHYRGFLLWHIWGGHGHFRPPPLVAVSLSRISPI